MRIHGFIATAIFGGDGIFLAALTGRGRVWLQTLPVAKLARAIEKYLRRENAKQTTEAAAVGGIVGSILEGMR